MGRRGTLRTLLRSWWFRIPAAFAVIVIAAALGWWFFLREDADLADEAPEIPEDLVESQTPGPSGTATTAPGAVATAAPGATRFVIVAERSEAAYYADEQLARLPLPSTAKGTTSEIEGEFYLDDDGLASSPESSFTVDLRNLESDEDRRDTRVQEALQTDQFPTVRFVVHSLDGFPEELVPDEDRQFTMTGDLELHGVTREVTWDVEARREGPVMTALATVTIRYDDYGITRPDIAGFVTVEEEVTLQVSVVAQAQ